MNIPMEEKETKRMLWSRVKAVIDNTIEPEVVQMAKAAGTTMHIFKCVFCIILFQDMMLRTHHPDIRIYNRSRLHGQLSSKKLDANTLLIRP
jgi:hypothetical protein